MPLFCSRKFNYLFVAYDSFRVPLKLNFARMTSIQIKIVNTSSNPLPEYATKGASGMDIRASLDIPLTLQPLERNLIPTGLFVEIPQGY